MILAKYQGTKSAVINSFNGEPLSLRQIYSRIGKNISMQAVHKHLKELVSEGVITKKNNRYELNNLWIESEKRKLEFIQKASKKNYEVTSFLFDSINEMDDFLIEFLKDNYEKTYSYWHNLWWPLLNMKKEFLALKNIKNKKDHYIVTSGSSIVEKWCAKCYRKLGFNAAISKHFFYECDFIIVGNKIVQIYWPDDLMKRLNKLYKVKDIKNLDLEKLNSIFESKTKIEIRISDNEFLCKRLKKKIIDEMNKPMQQKRKDNKRYNKRANIA